MSNQYSLDSIKDILDELDKESARIVISKEIRGRYKKTSTVIRGIGHDSKEAEVLTSELKTKICTGGTYKEGQIILQGDHREAVKQLLIKKGAKCYSFRIQRRSGIQRRR